MDKIMNNGGSVKTVTRRFTRRGALKVANRRNRAKPSGRSSGWGRIDYSITRGTGLRQWKVIARSR